MHIKKHCKAAPNLSIPSIVDLTLEETVKETSNITQPSLLRNSDFFSSNVLAPSSPANTIPPQSKKQRLLENDFVNSIVDECFEK